MANEAIIIELLGKNRGEPIRYNVADAVEIGKGTLLKIANGRVAQAATDGSAFAGIAASDKAANDGSTTLAAYTHGIFEIRLGASASADAGNRLYPGDANRADSAEAGEMLKSTIGIALADGAGDAWVPVLIGSGL